MEPVTLYTLGHSNRSLDDFIALLWGAGIQVLVDVRAQPHSSRYPQFSTDPLRAAMEQEGIQYHWAGRQLGGHRPLQAGSRHIALGEEVRGYADYMESAAFHTAAMQLIKMAGKSPTAILCAERRPEDCHRRLIADYLLLQGARVVHLIQPGEQHEHVLSPEVRRESAELVYDRNVSGQLDL